MAYDIIVGTDQPSYRISSAAAGTSYAAAVPTTTIPATTGTTFLIPSSNGDKPSLLRLTPYHTANNATGLGVRVIGWSVYTQTDGTDMYVPNLLAELTPAYNATSGSIPSVSVNGTTQYFFHGLTVATGVPTVNLYSPGTAAASGTPAAHALIDTIGHRYITLQFKSSSGTMNAFHSFL
jgi:hypothetical protein